MVCIDLKGITHEAVAELSDGPHHSQALQLGCIIILLRSVRGPAGTVDHARLAVLDLGQDGAQNQRGGIGIETECNIKIWVDRNGLF